MKKETFKVLPITKQSACALLMEYHYLSGISKSFKSGFNIGLYDVTKDKYVGVCIFTGFPVPELAVGCFGLSRNEQDGLFELSRFVIEPNTQANHHNISTWFMSRAIKYLLKITKVRAVLSYADSSFHTGVIYAACNFTYYGLSSPKSDFVTDGGDKISRGRVKGKSGSWVERSRKHRFLKVFDKKLECQWTEEKWNNSV